MVPLPWKPESDGDNVFGHGWYAMAFSGPSASPTGPSTQVKPTFVLARHLDAGSPAGQGYGYDASGGGVDYCKSNIGKYQEPDGPNRCKDACANNQYCTGITWFDSTHGESARCALHMGNGWRSLTQSTCPSGFPTADRNRGTNDVATALFGARQESSKMTTWVKQDVSRWHFE